MTVHRLKTYASSQGFVYQYYFLEKHPADEPDAAEYVFDVVSDGRNTYSVAIVFPRTAANAWAEAHGRSLSDSEQYAAVKMRLFRAFDEISDMAKDGRQLRIEVDYMEEALGGLGVE